MLSLIFLGLVVICAALGYALYKSDSPEFCAAPLVFGALLLMATIVSFCEITKERSRFGEQVREAEELREMMKTLEARGRVEQSRLIMRAVSWNEKVQEKQRDNKDWLWDWNVNDEWEFVKPIEIPR